VAFSQRRRRKATFRRTELVANGGFVDATGWTVAGDATGWSIGSGVATKAVSASASQLEQPITLVPGRSYTATFTITARTGGGATIRFTGGTQVNGTLRSTVGTFQETITALSGNNKLSINSSAASGLSIDNVSII
jgi:hypothetical protein